MSHVRSYFYVGGEYVNTTAGHVLQNQMYVEKLTPSAGSTKPYPIVFVHGGGQTGTNWLNKPDGGDGWASWFLEHGYVVYIVDQPHTGRSPWYPQSNFSLSAFPTEFIQQRFTAVENYPLWPQAHLHTQWPGTGMIGDPIFDAYYASTTQGLSNTVEQERTLQIAGIALLEKIGPVVLITHSQGGLAGWSWTDARPHLVKALIQIEPKGPPFREAIFSDTFTRPWGLTAIPLTYSPMPSDVNAAEPLLMKIVPSNSSDQTDCILQEEPTRQLANFKDVPILIDTGEASYHATYDYCFLDFLRQAGCRRVEHLDLGKAGIHGNAHLQFLEKNNDEIAAVLESWISKTVSAV